MSKTDDLKQIAQIRRAILPLIDLVRKESDKAITERLNSFEKAIETLLSKEVKVSVNAPDVKIDNKFDIQELASIITKSNKPLAKASEPRLIDFQPHDQSKSGVYQYAGFVRSDGSWYIQRVAKGEQRYASGKSDYSSAWEKKDSQKYGMINEVM